MPGPCAPASGMRPLLSMTGVSKAFGHVVALAGVDLDIQPGEVIGLLGDNGAGKSTLIKILSGVYYADEGSFERDGEAVTIEDPNDAMALGIATVYQDLSLVETRPVAHNIYLGREPRRWGLVLNRRKMERDAAELLERLNITLPSVRVDVGVLSGGQRQAVAISRAVAQGGDILLLDEPTASLGVEQTAQVHDLVVDMKSHGSAIVLITHDLSDILDIADRIVVLRQGRLWADSPAAATTQTEVIGWITGALPSQFADRGSSNGGSANGGSANGGSS